MFHRRARSISLGFQHVLTMFPATALVAIITGFDVAVTVFASGLATVLAALGSRNRIPLYYGGSFAYLAAVVGIVTAEYGSTELAQVGVVATGILNIVLGYIIKAAGKEKLDLVLPASVTGSIAIVIGLALSKEALDMATDNWGIALTTLLLTILFSIYLRGLGLLGMLPILLGAVCGYLVAAITGNVEFSAVGDAAWIAMPNFQLPAFTDENAVACGRGNRTHCHCDHSREHRTPLPGEPLRRRARGRDEAAASRHQTSGRTESRSRRSIGHHQRDAGRIIGHELRREQQPHGDHAGTSRSPF